MIGKTKESRGEILRRALNIFQDIEQQRERKKRIQALIQKIKTGKKS